MAFRTYLENGFIWRWSNETRIDDDYSNSNGEPEPLENVLTKKRLFEFLNKKLDITDSRKMLRN